MSLPEGYETWWSVEMPLWWRDLDTLGHLTATSYMVIYQEAAADFVIEAWGDADAMWVLGEISIDYLHEVRKEDGPIRVHGALTRLGRSSFQITSVLSSAAGRPCSTAVARFVAWDGLRRGTRLLTPHEHSTLLATTGQDGHLVTIPQVDAVP